MMQGSSSGIQGFDQTGQSPPVDCRPVRDATCTVAPQADGAKGDDGPGLTVELALLSAD